MSRAHPSTAPNPGAAFVALYDGEVLSTNEYESGGNAECVDDQACVSLSSGPGPDTELRGTIAP